MRYGLNKNFICGVSEFTSRTFGSSTGLISLSPDSFLISRHSPSPAKQAVIAYSVPSSSSPTSLSPMGSSSNIHHDLHHGTIAKLIPFSLTSPVQSRESRQLSSPFLPPTPTRPILFCLLIRHFSISHRLSLDKTSEQQQPKEKKDDGSKSKSLIYRFKKAYKDYGKVLIGFHCVTYCIYFTCFLGVSYVGLDVVFFLEYLRDTAHIPLPQSVIDAITHSGAGHFAVAFILCKLISPIHSLTTIVGTKYMADYLRRRGYMQPIPQGDKIGDLAKESQKLIEEKSAELQSRMARSGRKIRKENQVRISKTDRAVRVWRSKWSSKWTKKTPKR